MNILYIGPNDSEWAQMNRPVSLAAAKWARGFLTALSKVARVTALTHTYEVAWPKGKVFWRGRDERLYPKEWDCVSVSYPVLKYVREIWWRYAYAAKAKRIVREKRIDVVLMYNCYESWQVPVMRSIKKKYGDAVKILPIILDGDDPRKDGWGWIKKSLKWADGVAAVSWWICQNCPCNLPIYHMDGGADDWQGVAPSHGKSNKKRLVHTGALDKWRGLDFMTKVMKLMEGDDVKFVFCGKSTERLLQRKFGDNPQVELAGFVEEEKMRELCNGADVLLNVREPLHPDNILNYPSKLPHYLSFGRPIVSTRLLSLSPEYKEIIHFAADDTPESYVKELREVLNWDDSRRTMEYNLIRDWFISHKLWKTVASNLVSWIGETFK